MKLEVKMRIRMLVKDPYPFDGLVGHFLFVFVVRTV